MEVRRGVQGGAVKCLIYGPEGIGKSTFAARFPDPVFIDTEGSTRWLDVARFDRPLSWAQLLEQVAGAALASGCSTLVIDTLDWAERLCIKAVVERAGKSGIEDFGYGKGYTYAAEEFGRLINLLSDIHMNGVNIVLTAHAAMRKFEQPDEMGAYDRWELKLIKQIAPMVKEWADMVLFANYKTIVVTTSDNKRKAQGGQRVMYAAHHPCWDAKNRFGLPDELPFDYEQLRHIVEGAPGRGEPAPKRGLAIQEAEIPQARPPHDAKPAPAQGAESAAGAYEAAEAASEGDGIPACVPPTLRQLMAANDVTLEEIIYAVAQRGHYTADTPFENYDPAYVQGVLIGAWEQVYAMIEQNRGNTPF